MKENFRYQQKYNGYFSTIFSVLASLIVFSSCAHTQQKKDIPMHSSIVKQEFIYSLANAPTPQCHASTIAATDGKLVAAWFGGTREKNKDVGIWVSVKSDDQWSKPEEVVNGVQADGSRYPCWNPVLFQPRNGPLMLFYKVGPNPEEWWGLLVTSEDGGITWSKPIRLPDGIWGPIKNKPVQLTDGTILSPSSREDVGWQIHVEISDEKAKTWKSTGGLNDTSKFGAIQPTILIYPGNKLQMLSRTENEVISECWSEDNGRTWSEMSATSLPNPNSGIDGVTLKDGRQLLVYNPTDKNWGDRVPLSIALSNDGKKWTKMLDLEPVTNPDTTEDEEYSYPGVIQTADGLVHVVYTYNRETVKHVVVDPAKIN